MFDEALTPEQLIVITALTEGVSSTGAAAQAGVHRNTIANWRRNSLFFREALADAQYDRALFFREEMEDRLDRAFETMDEVLNDPKASASTRLKAAIFIIGKASTPPQPKKQVPFDISETRVSHPPVHNVHNQVQSPHPAEAGTKENSPSIDNHAQSAQPPAAPQPENPPFAYKPAQSAQMPCRREAPKVGRNELCPCGSGQKFKRCCLGKTNLSMAA